MEQNVITKLNELLSKYMELEDKLANELNYEKLIELQKLNSSLEPVVHKYKEFKKNTQELESLSKIEDEELFELAKEEISALESRNILLEDEIKIMLLPKDPNDEKNVVVEIRAGAGGEEASIFVSNLYRMYTRYIESIGWKHEEMTHSDSSNGLKEIVFLVKGKGAYSKLKFESGTHRVQRVPKTEGSGRIHTSTATVAVLPEASDVELFIDPKDVKVDVYRSSGAGGQSVNTTDSAVRLTHLPTGLIVTCQDERSQIKNRDKAWKFLKIKLYDLELQKQKFEMDSTRKNQIGSGDRSEKIRTYNFPQGRVTDHRIGLTLHMLDAFMEGNIAEMIDALIAFDQAEKLKESI